MKTKRFLFRIPSRTLANLECVKIKCEAETISEVVRKAVKLYFILYPFAHRDNEVFMRSLDQGIDLDVQTSWGNETKRQKHLVPHTQFEIKLEQTMWDKLRELKKKSGAPSIMVLLYASFRLWADYVRYKNEGFCLFVKFVQGGVEHTRQIIVW